MFGLSTFERVQSVGSSAMVLAIHLCNTTTSGQPLYYPSTCILWDRL